MFLPFFPLEIRSELHLKAKLWIPFGIAAPSCSGHLPEKLHHVWRWQHGTLCSHKKLDPILFLYFWCKENKFWSFLGCERLLITLRCACACPHFPCKPCVWHWLYSSSAWLCETDSYGRPHRSSFCFLISSECVVVLLPRGKESKRTVEEDVSSPQHPQMSAGHWELHLLLLKSAGAERGKEFWGRRRRICIFILLVVSRKVVVGMSGRPVHCFRRDECRKNMAEDKLAAFGWKFWWINSWTKPSFKFKIISITFVNTAGFSLSFVTVSSGFQVGH